MSGLDLHARSASASLPEQLRIATATADDFPALYHAWAEAEDWNPGHHEATAMLAQDPDGCFIGYLGDTPVATISVVNYDEDFAFLGCYRVAPEHRGRGLGPGTWKHALAHAEGRTIGLEGVPAQQDNYRAGGFTVEYRTVRFAGRTPELRRIQTDGIVPAADLDPAEIADFDARTFPADRPRLLAAWLTAPDHHSLALVAKGRLRGFGVIRPTRDGARVGPLLAHTPAEAALLFDSLIAHAAEHDIQNVAIDVPEPNAAGRALALARGLAEVSQTARMYSGTIRLVTTERTFGVLALETG